MSEMGELQGSLPEAVGTAGYTLAVGLFDIMVRKGIMTVEEARETIRDWSERSATLEGTANHDAATVLSGLAKYFNVNTAQ
jgi:polyhydroxyalkanoate synthesis regulator phasin